MLRRLLILAVIVAVLGLGVFWLVTVPATISASALGSHTPNSTNGRVMFFAGGCSSCHATPEQDDKLRLGGGLGLKSPFGTFYVPNISPDPIDGIGRWSEADFVTAMVKGTSPDGRHYFPAFPYTSYQRMTFADLRDLFAYIKTLAPVQGKARGHDVPFPFNIRRAVGAWKRLYLDGEPFKADVGKPAEWNRGAYLINGLSHCAECHSPRDVLGGLVESQRFAGGPDPGGEGWVPNITQQALRDWAEKDIAEMLATGMTPDDKVAGPMAEVVRNTGQLSAEDRAAMAAYIKSLPPIEGPKRPEQK